MSLLVRITGVGRLRAVRQHRFGPDRRV